MITITALAALNIAVLAGLLLTQNARHDRTIQTLTAAVTSERDAYIALVDRLCQRIQAPQQAVIDHAITTAPDSLPPAPIAMDDDDAYAEMRGVSKDELADLVMQAELAG